MLRRSILLSSVLSPLARNFFSAWFSCSATFGLPRISPFASLPKMNHLLPEESLPEKNASASAKEKHHDRMEELRRQSAEAEAGGGPERREREHQAGKLAARERVALLLDEGTFEELDKVVT